MTKRNRDKKHPLRPIAKVVVDVMSERDVELLIDILSPQPRKMLRVLDGGK